MFATSICTHTRSTIDISWPSKAVMLEEPSEIVTLATADEIQRTNPRAFHHDYYYIDMHFGLASIKHRTNSFKVVVNIFFSYHLHQLPRRVSYVQILQILFIRAHRSSLRKFESSLFLFFLISPLASSCPSTRQSRLLCASVSHKQMPLRTSHLV